MKTVMIVGNVGRDAEVRPAGDTTVLSFSVAVTDRRAGSEKTLWFDVSLFGEKRVQALAPHIRKGDKIAVTGDLDTHEHNGKTYLKVRAHDVTLCGGRRTEARSEPTPPTTASEDIPF